MRFKVNHSQSESTVTPPLLHKQKNSRLRTNKGQAIVEYILILTVVVMVMGGLLFKLNKGFQKWGKSIIGADGYIACLMQTGLLPGQSTTHLSNPCAPIENIDFSAESSSSSSSSGSSSSGGSSSSSSSSSGGGGDNPTGNDNNQNNSNTYSSTESSNSADSKRNHTRRNKNKGRNNPSGQLISVNYSDNLFPDDHNPPSQNTEETGGRSSRRKKGKMGFRDGLSSTNNNPGSSGRRFRAIGSHAYMLADKADQERRNTLIALTNTGSKKQKSPEKEKRSLLIKKEKIKTKDQDAEIGKWSFGNIFRIVLIILIICVVVFLIISQTTQVRKSMK